MAVYFDPSSPAVSTTISGSLAVNLFTPAGTNMSDEGHDAARVLIVGSHTAASLEIKGTLTGITNSIAVHVLSTGGTMAVNVGKTDGTIAVFFSPANPTMNMTGSVAVNLFTPAGTNISDEGHDAVRVLIAGSHAAASLEIKGTITGITNSIAVHVLSTGGTIMVSDKSEPTVVASGKQATTTRPFIVNSDGAIKIYDIVTGTIAAVTNITNSISVHMLSTGGTIAVKIDPSYNVVNTGSTIIIPQTASSSTSAVSVSGATVVSPVTSRLIKVYAFSLTTTGVVNITARFTNGAGTSPTEFWRVALRAPSTGIAGANLAVTPPGYLWATASGSTLSLLLDTASLVHYSVSYFLESA